MRKIFLSPHDVELFDTDITGAEYDFYQKHWDAFRRMWKEQGNKFWIKYIITFRKYANDSGLIHEIPELCNDLTPIVDGTFIFIHEQFIDNKFGGAKQLVQQILLLAQHQGKIQLLGQKSKSKDPFYNKETRDCFRYLFGPPSTKESYVKTCVMYQVYLRFGGSLCTCLKRWLEADEIPADDESYWINPGGAVSKKDTVDVKKSNETCKECHQVIGQEKSRTYSENTFVSYMSEKRNGHPCGPWFIPGWPLHEDPRFFDHKNPLYDLNKDPLVDWRDDIDYKKYLSFMTYVKQYYPCPDAKIEPDPAPDTDEETIALMRGMFEAGIGEGVIERIAKNQPIDAEDLRKVVELQEQISAKGNQEKKSTKREISTQTTNPPQPATKKVDTTEQTVSSKTKKPKKKKLPKESLEVVHTHETVKVPSESEAKKAKETVEVIHHSSSYYVGNEPDSDQQVHRLMDQLRTMGKGSINIAVKSHMPDGTPRKFLSNPEALKYLVPCDEEGKRVKEPEEDEEPVKDWGTLTERMKVVLGALAEDLPGSPTADDIIQGRYTGPQVEFLKPEVPETRFQHYVEVKHKVPEIDPSMASSSDTSKGPSKSQRKRNRRKARQEAVSKGVSDATGKEEEMGKHDIHVNTDLKTLKKDCTSPSKDCKSKSKETKPSKISGAEMPQASTSVKRDAEKKSVASAATSPSKASISKGAETRKTPAQKIHKPELKNCAFCHITEKTPKTFKKCLRCKQQQSQDTKYYCSKECQVEDWKKGHRFAHHKNETRECFTLQHVGDIVI